MVRVEDLQKSYTSGRGHVRVLAGISFSVGKGEVVILSGKSGSGKTTLLNCMGGLERPDRGRVTCLGVDIHALTGRNLSLFLRKHLGFVFQFGNLISYLTVAENIDLPLTLNGIKGIKRELRIRELLEKVGLEGHGPALPAELSGGEIQRVSLARAIAHKPGILFADEPTANLDTATGRDLVTLMRDLGKEQNTALVIATHDPDLMEIADRVLHIRDGCLE